MTDCLIAGVGGQGIVLASKLIAAAAMKRGFDVRTGETIGMAQRGGCVVSHIRIGKGIHSPMIPLGSADLIIAFEPAEGARVLPYLSKRGLMIVCDAAIRPVLESAREDAYQPSAVLSHIKRHSERLVVIDTKKLLSQCGGTKTMNVALLGAAVESGSLPFDANDFKDALTELLPQRFWAMNLNSFEIGRGMYHAL